MQNNLLLPATAVHPLNAMLAHATQSPKLSHGCLSFRVGGTHRQFQDRRTNEYSRVLTLLRAGHTVVLKHGSHVYTAVLVQGDVAWVRTAARRCRRNYTRVVVSL